MYWKHIAAMVSSAAVGGLVGTSALVWFLSAHPLVALTLIPPAATTLRVHRSLETVTAKRFVLIGNSGEELATLGADATSVGLRIYASGRKADSLPQISLETGYSLQTSFETGLRAAAITLTSQQGSEATLEADDPLVGPSGNKLANGGARLDLTGIHEQKYQDFVSLECDAPGEPFLSLTGEKGVALLTLSDAGPSLELHDDAENLRASLGVIELKHEGTGTIEKRPASSLVLFGKDGKVIWKAP